MTWDDVLAVKAQIDSFGYYIMNINQTGVGEWEMSVAATGHDPYRLHTFKLKSRAEWDEMEAPLDICPACGSLRKDGECAKAH